MSTNCVFPPELDERQLLAYLDDPTVYQETANHLKLCSYCQKKAEDLDRFQKHLTSQLYRSTCPSPVELGEFHMRMLPANQTLEMAQHVRKCPHCADEVSGLEEFLSEFTPRTGLLEPIKVLLARLVGGGAGTASSPGLMAVRGQVSHSPVFEADDIVISLDVTPNPNGQVSILGSMAAENQDQWTGATVELKQMYLETLIAHVDDLGTFSLEAVYPGATEVTITSPNGITVQTETVTINT